MLMEAKPTPGVSLYLPTHVRGAETRQDPIRLKNLIAEARQSLESAGLKPRETDAILDPAVALVEDNDFWQHQDIGLALFLGDAQTHTYKVPIAFDQKVAVGPAFHVTPLLPLLAADGAFHVLTITAQSVRLFEASRFSMVEDDAAGLPGSVDEVSGQPDYENPLQASPVGRPHTGAINITKSQVSGESPEDWRKANTVEFVHRIAVELERHLARHRLPVVLIADAEIQGHFQKLSDLGPLLAGVVETNPESRDVNALHAAAYDVVRPMFEEGRRRAVDHLAALLGSGEAHATLDAGEIVKAAHLGRIETLMLAEGAELRGRFDEATGKVTMGGEDAAERQNLLDGVAAQVLRHGGAITIVTPEEMPNGAAAAAVLRF
ncbi:hypothetical protein [Falsiroseomonas sp.]|uniref:baeRF3 domain-containing protein n=1 Tax=Falsiroseomonas sp. TaxID=2870721 RepID=UPI0035646881